MTVENLKAGKRRLKPSKTRQLNELAARIAGGEIKSREEMEEIKAISERLEGLRKKPGSEMVVESRSRSLEQATRNVPQRRRLPFAGYLTWGVLGKTPSYLAVKVSFRVAREKI